MENTLVGETQEQSEDPKGHLTQLVLKHEKEGQVPTEGTETTKAQRQERA